VKDAKDLIPWTVTDISIRPYDAMWSMNPSIHFDGQTWRCVLRCTDYAMPNGVTIRSPKAGPGHQSKNAMVIFDPATWKPIQIYKMRERDDHPRTPCATVGFEDMRIFKTDRGGLQGIAASLHLARDTRPAAGGAQHQPPEQVLLSFDAEYNIVKARPIRGDWWSGAQKNWVPFDGCAEPRFLYSIGKGTMFDDRGAIHGTVAVARPSASAQPVSIMRERERAIVQEQECAHAHAQEQERARERVQEQERESARQVHKHPDLRTRIRGGSVQLVRGRRVSADTLASRPSLSSSSAAPSRSSTRAQAAITSPPSPKWGSLRGGGGGGGGGGNESARMLGTGRVLLPRYAGLRGGTQLVRVGDDAWLGIGHEMQFLKSKKHYWHTWYLVDSRGKMTSVSEPMKLVPNGIEFAAGMAIDGDRVVVSFGVDDMECKIGETRLSAVMEHMESTKGD